MNSNYRPNHPSSNRSSHHANYWFIVALAVIAALIALFIKLAQTVRSTSQLSFDNQIMEWTFSIATPALTKIMLFITWLGNVEVLFIVSLIVSGILLVRRQWLYALYFSSTAVASTLSNIGLKAWLQRERPDVERIIEVSGFSFPSGHTMGAIAIYGMIGWLLGRHQTRTISKWIIGAATALLILLIGYSRVYLGTHYPSDIIAGLAAGGSLLIVSQLLLHSIHRWQNKKQNGIEPT